jgi:hypothetical protein
MSKDNVALMRSLLSHQDQGPWHEKKDGGNAPAATHFLRRLQHVSGAM